MKHNYLLPHKYQILGWILAAAAPVFFIITCLLYNQGQIRFLPSNAYTAISYLLLFSGMFLIAFSSEKTEDEMIRNIRARSIAIAAGIQFVFFIVWSLFYAFDHGLRFMPDSDLNRIIYYCGQGLTNSFSLFFLYIVIFRIKLFINR